MNGQCHNLLVVSFEWAENISQFNEDFIKSQNEDNDVR